MNAPGVAELFAPLGVRITAGPVEMRGITDDLLGELAEVAEGGIHEPDRMPFYHPWSTAPSGELTRNTAQYHWRSRASFTRDAWDLHLAVILDGKVIGAQGVSTSDFLVTRTGETGSWLGIAHQGRGTGTLMRQAFCAFLFDHLDFAEITSGAFTDNPASLAVSRKTGYRPDGVRRMKRRAGELALNQRLALAPEDLVRGQHPVEVEGVGPLRRLVGLDAG